jgi:hypothetical protein
MAVGTASNATTLSEKWNGTTVAILPSPKLASTLVEKYC